MPAYLLLFISALGCGNHAATGGEKDGAPAPTDAPPAPTDAPPSDVTAGCPKPVDCNDAGNCDVPPPVAQPWECLPITDDYSYTECSNGYVIIRKVVENSGYFRYYRDGKLFAVFSGHLQLQCIEGPADFVEPECPGARVINLCARDAAASSI